MLPEYMQIVRLIKNLGHTVVSEHVAYAGLEKAEAKLTEEEIFKSDIKFIDGCDCLVADITMPSIGVGYEICYAVSKGKRVVCVYKEGAHVSAMVLGNGRVISLPYVDVERLEKSLRLHLR